MSFVNSLGAARYEARQGKATLPSGRCLATIFCQQIRKLAQIFIAQAGYSPRRLIEPLFYDDLTLADVKVKITAEKKQTIKDEKTATYYIAQFSYEAADADEVAARRDFARDFPIWRAETYTGSADTRIPHGYTVPVQDDPTSPEPAAAEPLQLLIEQPPHNEAEGAMLAQLVELVATADPLPDLRDHAPAIRQLFPEPSYEVGCGGSHIWRHRADESARLACIIPNPLVGTGDEGNARLRRCGRPVLFLWHAVQLTDEPAKFRRPALLRVVKMKNYVVKMTAKG